MTARRHAAFIRAVAGLMLLGLAMTCRAQVPPLPCGAGGGLTVRGRLLDPPGGGADGVACCRLLVSAGGRGELIYTRGDGTFEQCFECSSPAATRVSVSAPCCSASAEQIAPQCYDPATGFGVIVDLGDITCPVPPGTDATLIRGSVLCRNGALLEPVADCGVLHDSSTPNAGPHGYVRTDVNGEYATCADCLGRDVTVTAQCCGETATVDLSACPERIQAPTMICDPCPVPPCPLPRDIEFRGRLVCGDADGDGLPDPVAGCDVTLHDPFACAGVYARVTTDANGFYSACATCPSEDGCHRQAWPVFASTPCCHDRPILSVQGCPPVVDFGTYECCPPAPPPPCPQDETIVRGRVTCIDPGLPNPVPVAGCPVEIVPMGPCGGTRVVTDANGEYSACIACPGCPQVGAIASCCGAQQIGPLACAGETVLDLACGSCAPPPPDPCAPAQTIVGRVTCDADGDGVPDPLAGCPIRVECLGVPGFDSIVTTNASGNHVACIPCTTCAQARVTALCCGQSTDVLLTPPDCVPARADIACLDCPPPSPCAISDQAILGRITCHDAGGQAQPMPGCDVRVECAGRPPLDVMTDANGDYFACLPCGACTLAVVTPACCGSPTSVPLDPASCLPMRQDIDCGGCVAPRPCPAPPLAMAVEGALACRQNGAALAGTVVTLEPLDAAGNALPGVLSALTDGAGRYRACVPCPQGIASIRASAQGCGVSSEAPAIGCPEMLSLGVMECDACSPCPQGSTRLQGQVHCRGGGPVASCALRVVVTTCDETLVLDATTDAQGKYRLCVPCPCDDTDVRVTALCCNASRVTHVDRCGPITPVPTLYCPSPCR